ncbi:hypothetical protein [uncultured Psychromonas sp.]|uniref:hypothetical protein n=1 Tax=uncultured Psychromonas sp. TaxID=173974 RepID=UPI00261C941B|nr:hypothetical protein [uncultured Psychromonas sp.]
MNNFKFNTNELNVEIPNGVVYLTTSNISKISKDWFNTKYGKTFRLIAGNPGIRTHEIHNKTPCNNASDQSTAVNKKLAGNGLKVICVKPDKKEDSLNGSHHWFLVETKSKSHA